jgi:CBS domain-containing protein
MKIKDVIRHDFLSVDEDATLIEVGAAVVFADGGPVAVIGDGGDLVGIIGESDLLPQSLRVKGAGRAFRLLRESVRGLDTSWKEWAGARRARDVMRPAPAPIGPDADLAEIARHMLESDLRYVPVKAGSAVIGILGRPELLRVLRSRDLTLQRSVERLLWRCGFAPPEYIVDVDVADGRVLLEGEVASEEDSSVIETLVTGLDGVSSVGNLLSVRHARRVSA